MRISHVILIIGIFSLFLIACTPQTKDESVISERPTLEERTGEAGYSLQPRIENVNDHLDYTNKDLKNIYFAGGCFWGVEAYMQKVYGVSEVTSGYANGSGEDPSYEDVMKGDDGFVEAVEVIYDPERVSAEELIDRLFQVIDPTSKNRQGNDVGVQYRTGIYFADEEDASIVKAAVEKEQQYYEDTIVTEAELLTSFYSAEEYHQDYLAKNPDGYCHIDLHVADDFLIVPIQADEDIIKQLSEE